MGNQEKLAEDNELKERKSQPAAAEPTFTVDERRLHRSQPTFQNTDEKTREAMNEKPRSMSTVAELS